MHLRRPSGGGGTVVARAIVGGIVIIIIATAACAQIADLQEPSPDPLTTTEGGAGGDGQAPSNDGASSSGTPNPDANKPAPEAGPTCGANGTQCTVHADCCGKCVENGKCETACRPIDDSCTLGDSDDCCIGTTCRFYDLQTHCCVIPGRKPPETAGGNPNKSLCCSNNVDGSGNCT